MAPLSPNKPAQDGAPLVDTVDLAESISSGQPFPESNEAMHSTLVSEGSLAENLTPNTPTIKDDEAMEQGPAIKISTATLPNKDEKEKQAIQEPHKQGALKRDDGRSDDESEASNSESEDSEGDYKSTTRLIASFTDYMRIVDKRIKSLENRMQDGDQSSSRRGSEDYMSVEVAEPQEEKLEHMSVEGSEPGEEDLKLRWPDIVLETKFFNAQTELGAAEYPLVTAATKKSSFYTVHGAKYIIKVLYNPRLNSTHVNSRQYRQDAQHTPSPDEVDMVTIRITSEPVVTFLELELGITPHILDQFEANFTKPFRPLIRFLQPLKEEITRTENRIRQVPLCSAL
jgi:hypothetical protein